MSAEASVIILAATGLGVLAAGVLVLVLVLRRRRRPGRLRFHEGHFTLGGGLNPRRRGPEPEPRFRVVGRIGHGRTPYG